MLIFVGEKTRLKFYMEPPSSILIDTTLSADPASEVPPSVQLYITRL